MKRWISKLRRHSHGRRDSSRAALESALAAQEAINLAWVAQHLQVDCGPHGERLHRR
ncbi:MULTISPECIES: hypothetical protein [unclassified Pseudomonas]|uniref:hypothetical protein n=1 Tax=unclassified Pseudomonas TaxID=196821 RepID=UPI00257A2281|nr:MULTISPECIES: hypothetical protein [unclassified Pseudomonas]